MDAQERETLVQATARDEPRRLDTAGVRLGVARGPGRHVPCTMHAGDRSRSSTTRSPVTSTAHLLDQRSCGAVHAVGLELRQLVPEVFGNEPTRLGRKFLKLLVQSHIHELGARFPRSHRAPEGVPVGQSGATISTRSSNGRMSTKSRGVIRSAMSPSSTSDRRRP